MADQRDKTNWRVSTGPNLLSVLVLGLAASVALVGNPKVAPISTSIAAFSLSLVWVYLLLSGLLLFRHAAEFRQDPVPTDLDLSSREAVRSHLESLRAKGPLSIRAKHLLEGWSNGWTADQAFAMAGYQRSGNNASLAASLAFSVLVIAPAIWLGDNSEIVAATLAAVAIMLYAQRKMLSTIEDYLESRILKRLPASLTGTNVTTGDLAGAIGKAIEQSFKQHIPQPDQMASSISTAVAESSKTFAEDIRQLQKSFVDNQGSLVDKWANAEQITAERLLEVEKALTQGETNKVEQLQAVLGKHVESIQSANQQLTEQLGNIVQLGGEIEKVLHVQRTVEGAVQSLSASEDFKQLITSLREHLEASDKLLRDAAKPRRIRLIESEPGNVSEA